MIRGMESTHVNEAVELLEKANADLEPELLSVPEARERLRPTHEPSDWPLSGSRPPPGRSMKPPASPG